MIAPNYFGNYQYPQYQQQQTPQNGFVVVRSEAEARNYPIAAGNSITFKDENAPYIYTKTMGFSQFDRPVFEKFKMVKEEPMESKPPVDEISEIKAEINRIKEEIEGMKNGYKQHNASSKSVETEPAGDTSEPL